MHARLGEVLVETGILDEGQVQMILERQRYSGQPFGVLAEDLCDVDPVLIEEAWARQYARLTRTIDPTLEYFCPRALGLVTRRQAWQFRVLPIRFDGPDLMMATTERHLRRALRFATNVLGVPAFFVMCTTEALGEALCHHYPLPGMTTQSIDDDLMDLVLRKPPA